MNYKIIFTGLFLLAFLGWAHLRTENTSMEEEPQQPNILLFLVDDLGKEWVSSYGAEEIQTPNIDILSQTGLKLDNFYSMPQCTPSRVTLMTGQYPYTHGWVNHWDVPRWGAGAHFDWTKNNSVASLMQNAGYKTAVAGKWQINDFRDQPEAMVHHGFDDYCMWTGGENGNPKSDERYWNPYIHTKEGSKTYEGMFGEDVFSDFLIDFMKKNKEEPMFLYYPLCLTHTPFTSTPHEPNVTEKYDCHKAMVRYMDFIVGKMMNALDDLEIRENTIVMFTTDNGTTQSITGTMNGRTVKGGKMLTAENGICEPFIVNCPGIVPQGVVSDALGDLSDILPTCVELSGQALPKKCKVDGHSLAQVVLGNQTDGDREWILAMGGDIGGKSRAAVSKKGLESNYVFRDRVIRNKRYKLYVSTDRKPVKLFDLREDPAEKNNIIDDKSPLVSKNLNLLLKAMESMPERDNDPIYEALTVHPWSKPITVNSQEWKL